MDKRMNDPARPSWHDLATDWTVWLSLAACLVVATIASLLGYD